MSRETKKERGELGVLRFDLFQWRVKELAQSQAGYIQHGYIASSYDITFCVITFLLDHYVLGKCIH